MFTTTAKGSDSKARSGILSTRHLDVETPCFMPVATKGAVKTLISEDLVELGVSNIIANAYLLYLRPGPDIIEEAGGLHGFMNWDRSVFTDSGGFQIIRKGFEPRVTDRGVELKSPFDGRGELFTPERCCRVQESLGSDVAMVLDDCAPRGSDEKRVKRSVDRTAEWAGIFLDAHTREDQAVFGITQGGTFEGLRAESARKLAEMDLDGYGIGGLCIGEPKEVMYHMADIQLDILPDSAPKYLMGVGTPVDILRLVGRGVDLFDSVYPTRNARHRTALTRNGSLNVNARNFKHCRSPLEGGCECPVCASYGRDYIYHLFKVKELSAMRLLTVHNLHFMMSFMRDIRAAVDSGEFAEFKDRFIGKYEGKGKGERKG